MAGGVHRGGGRLGTLLKCEELTRDAGLVARGHGVRLAIGLALELFAAARAVLRLHLYLRAGRLLLLRVRDLVREQVHAERIVGALAGAHVDVVADRERLRAHRARRLRRLRPRVHAHVRQIGEQHVLEPLADVLL